MLYLLLIAAAVLLTTTNLIAFRSKQPGRWITALCLVTIFCPPLFLGILIPLAGLLALLLILSMLIGKAVDQGPGTYRILSIISTVVVLSWAGEVTFRSGREYDRLRALYPYRSLEGRLPVAKASPPLERPLRPAAEAHLVQLENNGGFWETFRSRSLMRLHEQRVDLFINSVGLGIERMPTRPSEYSLNLRRGPVPLQPGPRVAFSSSPGDWIPMEGSAESSLSRLLDQGILDFANPQTFGYIKDRQHLAGFEPHRFSAVPETKEAWKVQTLDLVGLLLEPEPRVYVSDKLPSMENVRAVPTRPLDKFELVGLLTLRDGEDLWIAREGNAARMLGAIRSTNQCIDCHEGSRGDLLGAFSYTLLQMETAAIDPTHQ